MLKEKKELTVVKRNGRIVPFCRERIEKAIEAAFRDTKKEPKPEPLNPLTQKQANTVIESVLSQATKNPTQDVTLTVEGIQDLVEIVLMKEGHHDVARDYIVYRHERTEKRENGIEHLRVLRKDSMKTAKFCPIKLSESIQNISVSGDIDAINTITHQVVEKIKKRHGTTGMFTSEEIQETVEHVLMEEKWFKEVKAYILNHSEKKEKEDHREAVNIMGDEGKKRSIKETHLKKWLSKACEDLVEDPVPLIEETKKNFYDEMTETEFHQSAVMAARSFIEKDPQYSYVASRLLLDKIYQETIESSIMDNNLKAKFKKKFPRYITKGVQHGLINKVFLEFDLEKIANALKLERDESIQYLGLQTLYDRYFIHQEQTRIECPQYFWMRVAMGLSINEDNREEKAIEFYEVLSSFYYVSSTPTLFNAGTCHSQLSSCYLSTINDDLHHIYKVISDDAQLSKWAGGIGNDWTNVRAMGSPIRGTNGESQGIIPFMKVANDTAVAVNQGGKRKGAMCAYLETWHLDIEDFLELRKNTGDERRRTHDMNTANWIPDLFMQRVEQGKHWTLFTPSETKDLHDLYGKEFKKRYEEYEALAEQKKIRNFKKVDAVTLWRKMLGMIFETGHPWITFKDPSNIRGAQDHQGVIHSSNLCTEIVLNTSAEETAVCNLGSINLPKHMNKGKVDKEKLEKTIQTAMRMLDNVIDINFYPTKEGKFSNQKHRPVGIGIMGFQDLLYKKRISYGSHEAIQLADEVQEFISYHAILSSSNLAKERGAYPSFPGSKWDRGLLPIDTIDLLEKERGEIVYMDRSMALDWKPVRDSIKRYGMRNSHTMAIAPTATIANITGVTQSIEPTYKNLFVKSNLSGEFTIVNEHLVRELKKLEMWDDEMLDDLKYYDGSLQEIDRIPQEIKQIFATAFEVEAEWIIECASRRQKWIDQAQSLNLYIANPSGKALDKMYKDAWKKGLKTTYYLRSMGATQIEKSTTDINKRGLQPRWMKNKSASSNIEVNRPKTCSLDEGCESCQ